MAANKTFAKTYIYVMRFELENLIFRVVCKQDMLLNKTYFYSWLYWMYKWSFFIARCHWFRWCMKGLMLFSVRNFTKTSSVIWWIFGDGLACCPIERILVWRELYLGPDIFKVLAARYSTLKYSTLRNILQTQRHENCKLPSFNIVPSIIYGRSAT